VPDGLARCSLQAIAEARRYPWSVFKNVHRFKLDDGRQLIVQYQGEDYGWGAYVPVPGGPDLMRTGGTPYGAIALASEGRVPRWARQVSDDLLRQLREAPRHPCECCGYYTILNPGHYDTCDVCGWEDDRCDSNRPEEVSGPNRISLAQGRANFAAFGASDDRSRHRVRTPRPEEHPPDP
jgi:hypothetical protein